jgi:hypothetical protein
MTLTELRYFFRVLFDGYVRMISAYAAAGKSTILLYVHVTLWRDRIYHFVLLQKEKVVLSNL